jgi:hypothetical protein
MRILFLSYEIPKPLDAGDRIYIAGLLRTLVRNRHDVHLVALDRGKKPNETTLLHRSNELIEISGRVTVVPFSPKSRLRASLSPYPGMITNRYSRDYVRTVRRILENQGPFDVIIVNHFKMAYVVKFIRRAARQTPMILVSQSVEKLYAKSIYQNSISMLIKVAYFVDAIKMRVYEPLYMKLFDVVTAISETDYKYFIQR